MTQQLLTDSGFLRILYDAKHPEHPSVYEAAKLRAGILIIPDVVLTEVAFLFRRDGGVPAVLRFLDTLNAARPRLEAVNHDDLIRARDIMATYLDAQLDFVDCCIMALAERLNVTHICTTDYRDFSIFRPKHCPYFELIP